MDYEILMRDGMDGPSLDTALEKLVEDGVIASYHRFKTGHYSVKAENEVFYSALAEHEGIEQIVAAPTYVAKPSQRIQ